MPLLEMASVITDCNIGPLTLTRRGAPTRNAYGEYIEAAAVLVILDPVAVHTASSRTRENLPEAIRNRETIELYTLVRLYVGDSQNDVVSYQGRNYVVSFTDDYAANGGVFLSLATLEDTNG